LYLNEKGEQVLLNQREVLDALAAHKDEERNVPPEIDKGEPKAIAHLHNVLQQWIKKQTVEEEVQEDGSVKERMGKAGLDLLSKLKTGQKSAVETIKDEKLSDKYKKDNLDLITWFVVS
jgi:hypothetical protein